MTEATSTDNHGKLKRSKALRASVLSRLNAILVVCLLAVSVFVSSCSTPMKHRNEESGLASWYGKRFHGRKTANGERFNMHALTAAHPSLPFGTKVQVRNLRTGKSVVVRINDRGPYVSSRVIDLSYAAALKLGMISVGEDEVVINQLASR